MKSKMILALILSVSLVSHGHAQVIAAKQRFHPVQAEQQMVVTQSAPASIIGRDILRRGGNAIDAAVAVGFALAVTLPRAGNIGGGGFMVIRMADGEATTIDFRETAPDAATRDMFLNEAGEADATKSRSSGLGVGVPGTVAGLYLAWERYGSGNLSFAELVEPAFRLADGGFVVPPSLADILASPRVMPRLLADTEMRSMFYPDGKPPRAGDRLVLPDLARTLDAIREQGPDGFYTGPVAEAIVSTVAAKGGVMTLDDLATYEPKIRAPIVGQFKDLEVISMPPPSSGGILLVQLLNILEDVPFGTYGLNSADMIHAMAEASKYAYADRAEYLGDPDFVDVPIAELTSKEYAREIAARIDPAAATPSSEISSSTVPLPPESNETTHYSVVDAEGNAVSVTYTLNFSFGVGFAAAGAGVILNNELDDFAAKPNSPNAFGLLGGDANAVAPRKRPLSSMTPTIVTRDGDLLMVTGSPGGSRIITTVLQLILNATVHRRDIATATGAPRVHHQWLPDYIRIEEGISHDTIRLLEEKGHDVRVQAAMGSAQSIFVAPDGRLHGASDTRRPGGLAAGD